MLGNALEGTVGWVLPIVVVLVLVAFPWVASIEGSFLAYFLFLSFCYVVLAQGWNLIAGYTGQISLGHHIFFGLGAYTTGIVWLNDMIGLGHYYFNPVLMVLSGLVPAVFAALIGVPLLSRLRGDYFAFGTLGVGQILTVLFLRLRDQTGGADGLRLPSGVYESMAPYYWTGLFLAVLSTLVIFLIVRSRVGMALRAIREDEMSAASHGVPVLQYKVLAFSISAFLAGIAGSLYAQYLFHINPDSVLNINWTFYPILMCVLGGNGTIAGPVIGAFLVAALLTFGDIYFPDTHPIVSGLLIILVMKFMPSGLVGIWERVRPGVLLRRL